VSFTLLTSSVRSSDLQVRGAVRGSFRPAYDILVRPAGSFTAIERSRGLVRSNYLSGIFGGISFRQYDRIRRLPGIGVAAPIANLGYILPFTHISVPVTRFVRGGRRDVYRVRTSWTADGGSSEYPGQTSYVYVTPNRAVFTQSGFEEKAGDRSQRPLFPCKGFEGTKVPDSPFARFVFIDCFSLKSPEAAKLSMFRGYSGDGPGTVVSASFPVLLAAVDPEQEARLVGLRQAVFSGRFLRETEASGRNPNPECPCGPRIPVIASTRTYIDQRMHVSIERLKLPAEPRLLKTLQSPRAPQFLAKARGTVVGKEELPPSVMYRQLLAGLHGIQAFVIDGYWTVAPARYRDSGESLAPLSVKQPPSVWRSTNFDTGWYPAPPGNEDIQFRRQVAHPGAETPHGSIVSGIDVVGRFDPTRLRGFSGLSKVPLESYYPPQADPADLATERALGGQPLRPSMNLGDYISQPPLMLTTLTAARQFLGSWRLTQDGKRGPAYSVFEHTNAAAPISVIRVRVRGVKGPDPLSLERIRVVAQKIHDDTGLAVDITAGSSPHPLLIDLPAGKFGRPALVLREGWSKKGVAVAFLRKLDKKDAALFALVLLICGLFIANGALASVRARRAEIGVLRTIGWSGRNVFGVILGELALIGLLSGLAGVSISVVLVYALSLDLSLWWTFLVLPIAVAVLALGGVGPALVAAAGRPLDALRTPVSSRGQRTRIRHVRSFAWVNLRRLPARTVLGAAGLFIGVAALSILIGIQRSFHGTLVGTLLGNAISLQVRGADFVAVALTIALAGLSVADVLYLNLRERSAELATLRALGWSERQVALVVLLEGIGLGALGSVAGAVAGFALGWALLGVPPVPLLVAAAIAAAGGIVIAVLGSLLPLTQIGRLSPHAVLAAE
jgi:putative ABC transport system permease protein